MENKYPGSKHACRLTFEYVTCMHKGTICQKIEK